jgi:DNA-binding SARP family transcriptional activator
VTVIEDLLAPVLPTCVSDLTAEDVVRLKRAVALHRGQLIEHSEDEWVLRARTRLETIYLSALDHLIQYCGAQGDVAAAGRYGVLALTVEPLREDVHRHLMSAYGSAGRLDLVERQFEQCRMVFLAELMTDPMPETVALYTRLTRRASGQAPSVAALVAELEGARREIVRLGAIVDRALDHIRRMP